MSSLLEICNISKSFKEYSSELHRIASWFGVHYKPAHERTVLHDVSFTVGHGEAVAIVGQNGAGKSTLLKIITGTLKQTEGTVHIHGRISAILELGMGFQPDLTGRQNVYHSAGLMGFTRQQINAVMHEIEAFAEIGVYFDQPVRTYSSGMQMRLAFSVATMYRPEILIVDEALSVGDAYFQHKSFSRIRQFRQEGTTLLLVSHDKGTVQAICDKAVLLEKGSIVKSGNPEEVMDYYNALIAEKENSMLKQIKREDGRVETTSGTGEAKLISAGFFNTKKEPVEYISVGEAVTLEIACETLVDIEEMTVGFMIKDRLGQPIFGTNTHHYKKEIKKPHKGEHYLVSFIFNMNLGVGSYSVAIALHADNTHVVKNYQWKDQAVIFHVLNASKEEFIGSSWLDPKVEVFHVE
ncbi:ABC transporter ATP-binding protein [Sulfurimonas sp. NWX367]|uniref:ABC transporter ATP-binding protein n=2 Tax=unclassified Sulfurimonas TaxID=2623549 RepID=UPI003204AF71